jgi:hypothetical protein
MEMDTKKETFQTKNVRYGGMFWPVAVLLAVGAIAIAWMAYPFMTERGGPSTPLPVAQAVPDSVAARLDWIEEKFNGWPQELAGMKDRMSQMEKSLSAGIRRARSETTALAEGIKRDMGQSLEALQARLTGIESTQSETHEQVASLQGELATVRRDLAGVREENARLAGQIGQIEQVQEATHRKVTGVENAVLWNQDRVDTLAYDVQRHRVDFEVEKDRSDEIINGIYLTVNRTNVARQQVDGWLQIAADGRFVRLNDSNAQHPIAFSSRSDDRAYQLVFTRITQDSVAGYVLAPAAASNTATAAK